MTDTTAARLPPAGAVAPAVTGMPSFAHNRPDVLSITPIAPHLRGSQVYRMVQEEGGVAPVGSAPQWPPPPASKLGSHNFMAKCARIGGRAVEWPPRGSDPTIYLSNPSLKFQHQPQVASGPQPPVPPRPSLHVLKAHSSAPNLAITSESELPKPPPRLPSGTDPPTGVPPVPPPPAMASQSSVTSSSSQPQQPGTEANQTTTYPSNFKLRSEMPIQQERARVVTSQPAFKMTKPMKMRGDSKWPPASANQEENQEQEVREFIKPKKQCKDYSGFFAQHQLPPSYTGYRAPPGTQHVGYDESEDATDM